MQRCRLMQSMDIGVAVYRVPERGLGFFRHSELVIRDAVGEVTAYVFGNFDPPLRGSPNSSAQLATTQRTGSSSP